jgi:hypothetical protein
MNLTFNFHPSAHCILMAIHRSYFYSFRLPRTLACELQLFHSFVLILPYTIPLINNDGAKFLS